MDAASVISRRSLLSAPIAMVVLGMFEGGGTAAWAADAPHVPLLPLNTNFSYWDHHWIQWIDHPVYEAIEVALAQPTPDAPPLVRLWLTERAGAKRQVYYFNDEAVARTFPQESHFVQFAVEHEGQPGFARSLSLAFTDKDGLPIRWEMRFPPAQPLSRERAGLKPQNGHGAATVLLFWYVDLRADGGDGRLLVGSDEYLVRNAAGRADTRYRAAYNSGAYVGVVSYGSAEISPTNEGFRSSWAGGRPFQRQPGPGRTAYVARTRSFNQPSTIELECDAAGAVAGYRHTHRGKTFSVDFDAPLVLASNPQGIGFRLAIEGNPVASGTVGVAGDTVQGRQLRWEFADPSWAREVGLSTLILPQSNGGYAMRVAPLH